MRCIGGAALVALLPACGGSNGAAPPTYLELAARLDSYLVANDLTLDAEQREALALQLAKQDLQQLSDADVALRAIFSRPTHAQIVELVDVANSALSGDWYGECALPCDALVKFIEGRQPQNQLEAHRALADYFTEPGVFRGVAGAPGDFEVRDHNE